MKPSRPRAAFAFATLLLLHDPIITLTGSALLMTGSLVYLGCVFAGGYAAAWFFRRQWHD